MAKNRKPPAQRRPPAVPVPLPSGSQADIGGTFTDVAAFDEGSGRLLLGKSLSTPRKLVDGISDGVAKTGAEFGAASIFLHGSTIAINTMLERSGAKTALITNEGFRDVYEIGRINRPDAYNLYFKKHEPLIRRSLRFEVRERLTAKGCAYPARRGQRSHGLRPAESLDIEAVAIMFLHSYRNPAHGGAVKEMVQQRFPQAFVSASHELSQEYREYERCSTVAANAFIGPRVSRYVQGIEDHLKARSSTALLLVQSTGGLYESAQAREQCIRMLESVQRRASSVRRRCARQSACRTPLPSTWVAPPPRPGSSTRVRR